MIRITIQKAIVALTFILLSVSSHAQVTYYHANHIGSPIAASDEDAKIIWTKIYSPFGTQEMIGEADDKHEIGFAGHPLDESTKTNYMGARHYEAEIGRFLSLDKAEFNIENPQSFNPYMYSSNSPLRYTDPTGEAITSGALAWCLAGPVGCAAGVGVATGGFYVLGQAASSLGAIFENSQATAATITLDQPLIHVAYNFPLRDGSIYSGITSGFGDPYTIAQERFRFHHMRAFTDAPAATPIGSSLNYYAIRGFEEMNIRFNGGAQSWGGYSGNPISSIGPLRPDAQLSVYRTAALLEFPAMPDNSPYRYTRPFYTWDGAGNTGAGY